MRIVGYVLLVWTAIATPTAFVVGRLLRAVSPVPMEPDLPADWLIDTPVDVWSQVRYDAEFWALVSVEADQ